jgi:polysaccharide export outer membrane protein
MKVWLAPALAGAVMTAACGGPPPLRSNSQLTVSDTGVLPPPTRADVTAQGRTYVIGPQDRLSIEVYGIQDLSRVVQVDSSGRISLPLIGEVQVGGMSPAEVAREVETRMAGRFVRNPQVSVNIAEALSQVVTVEGEVEEPGIYPIVGRMTLIRAIARAKGTTEFSQLSHVVLFRDVEGQHMAALYDLRAIRQGLYADPEIYPNDVVVVGEDRARRLFRDLIQGSGLITTPIIALLQGP